MRVLALAVAGALFFSACVLIGVAVGQKGGATGAASGKAAEKKGEAAGPARPGGAPGARTTVGGGSAATGTARARGEATAGAPAPAAAGTQPEVQPATVSPPFEDWRANPFLVESAGEPPVLGRYNFPNLSLGRSRAPAGWYRISRPAAERTAGTPIGAPTAPTGRRFAGAEELAGLTPEEGRLSGALAGVRASAVMLGSRTHAILEWPSGNSIIVRPGQQIAGGFTVDAILSDRVVVRDAQGGQFSIPLTARPPQPEVAPAVPAPQTYMPTPGYTPTAPIAVPGAPAPYAGYRVTPSAPSAPVAPVSERRTEKREK